MYEKVILAFDGAREARRALREGALAEGPLPGALDQLDAASRVLMDEGLAVLKKFGLAASGHVLRGDPAPTISAFAREVAADLVVVGHRRRNFLERWWSGTSGAYIVDDVECSLLVARRLISDTDFASEMGRLAGAAT